jgi:RNA polymerase sigma-70 factor (ECF subfamily)
MGVLLPHSYECGFEGLNSFLILTYQELFEFWKSAYTHFQSNKSVLIRVIRLIRGFLLFFARAAEAFVVLFMSMVDSEITLVRKARDGDRPAFEELVRRTSRLVFARLYLETGDRQRSEDLLQETLLVAYRRLRSLDDAKNFRAWLLTIAQNLAVDAMRFDQRKKRAILGRENPAVLANVPGNSPGPEQEMEREETRAEVLAVLRSLPEEYRLPLTLRYIGGADYESICWQLGLTNGSLRGLLHRGMKLLRTELQQVMKDCGEPGA